MRALARARDRLREQGTLLLAPELAELVAGEPVRGSWWSHPKSHAIFAVATKLEDDADVLTAKLVDGKVTFLAARLWPALFRVVTDRAWRRARSAKLTPDARALLTRVERVKRLTGADPKPRRSLESLLLVRSFQAHTRSGNHETVLQSWRAWASPEVVAAAAALTFEDARATLSACRIVV